MILKLIEPTLELEKQYMDYITEWENKDEKIVPSATKRNGRDYIDLLEEWKRSKTEEVYALGFVPSTLYFLVDENHRIYGAIHIRHELNDFLLSYGGHIGYGIRPSERKKGYASKMLSMALPKVKELGIKRALITCDKENIGSAKTILNNGGVLENEILQEGELTQRYWIEL